MTKPQWFLGLLLTSSMIAFSPAGAQIAPVQPNATIARNLKTGEVILQGDKGNYLGYTVVQGDIKSLWQVLTDYDNFEKYMPNVVESNLLESRGRQKVFEQVQVFQVLLFSRRAKVKILVEENYPKGINFRVTEGEVKSLQGSWKIEPLGANKFLLTHRVSVEPNIESKANRNLFFSVYADTVEKTLKVIPQETAKRAGNP